MSYTVQSGDSLSAIAKRAGIPISDLLLANPALAACPDLIHPGDILALPTSSSPHGPPSPAAVPPAAPAMSEAAIQLILMSEVSSADIYRRSGEAPAWPQGQSGVTIGVGYDLGYATAAQFRADWSDQLDPASLDRLAECCGLTGSGAQRAAAAVRDIAVPWEAAAAVFRDRTVPATARRTAAALAHTGLLGPDSFGALVSLVYNRGAAFAAAGDRFAEMRAIAACMASQNFAAIPAEFRAMKRLWLGEPGMAGLVTRREREAILFESGLGGVAPTAKIAAAEPVSP